MAFARVWHAGGNRARGARLVQCKPGAQRRAPGRCRMCAPGNPQRTSTGVDPQGIKTLFRERASIAEVIEEKVELKPAGSNRKQGLCPFHHEKTPSFVVYEETNTFHCFGCGKNGDIISFVQETEKVGYREAVEKVARKFNLLDQVRKHLYRKPPTPQELDAAEQARREEERLFAVMEHATEYYAAMLWSPAGNAALQYLYDRGFTEEVLQRFRIGFAPRGKRLVDELKERGFEGADLVAAGVVRGEGDNIADAMGGRIVIPIGDKQGKTIAFGGRKMYEQDGGPKYLNTKETILFKKGETLFAEHLLPPPQAPATALIVEGYFDVVTLHQHGLVWGVSCLGTGLTIEQLRRAARHSRDRAVTVNMDGDDAGRTAILKSCRQLFPKAMREGIDVRLAFLPDSAKDPDSFLQSRDVNSYVKQVLSESESWFLWFSRGLAEQVQNVEGMHSLLRTLGELLADAIPPRKEGTGFVAKEYARLLAAELAKVFGRPEYEEETSKEIIRSFWAKRMPGQTPYEANRYNSGYQKNESGQGLRQGARFAPRGPPATATPPAGANPWDTPKAFDHQDLKIHRAELSLLRVVIQRPDLRKRCYELVEQRGIKFRRDENIRVYHWLRERDEEAGPDELFEDMHYDKPVPNVDEYFFVPAIPMDPEREMEKSLMHMEFRRRLKIMEAIDVRISRIFETYDVSSLEQKEELTHLNDKRLHNQRRVTQLRDEYQKLDLEDSAPDLTF